MYNQSGVQVSTVPGSQFLDRSFAIAISGSWIVILGCEVQIRPSPVEGDSRDKVQDKALVGSESYFKPLTIKYTNFSWISYPKVYLF